MKYEESKASGLGRQTLRELEQIAMRASYSLEERGGIEGRDSDWEDFPDISVNAIQTMLEEAYRLGLRDGKQAR